MEQKEQSESAGLQPQPPPDWVALLTDRLALLVAHHGASTAAVQPVLQLIDSLIPRQTRAVSDEEVNFADLNINTSDWADILCHQCSGPLVHPVTLPCQHSYCLPCLFTIIETLVNPPNVPLAKIVGVPCFAPNCKSVFDVQDLYMFFEGKTNVILDTMVNRIVPRWLRHFGSTRARVKNYRKRQAQITRCKAKLPVWELSFLLLFDSVHLFFFFRILARNSNEHWKTF